MYRLKNESFWSAKEKPNVGSWMWRKILKLRYQAQYFHRVETRSGRDTSFWFDHWSDFGRLHELLGERGHIDLRIDNQATMAEVIHNHRRRRHRIVLLNNIEEEIDKLQATVSDIDEDVHKWKKKHDKFSKKFSSKATWLLIREPHRLRVDWEKIVWFTHATPKYSFLLWTAMHNRLAIGDCMSKWSQNIDTSCVFCQCPSETKSHLFFTCPFSAQVWKTLVKGILGTTFSADWDTLTGILKDLNHDRLKLFVLRYTFHATVYALWSERNIRRHDEPETSPLLMVKYIDQTVEIDCVRLELLGTIAIKVVLCIGLLQEFKG